MLSWEFCILNIEHVEDEIPPKRITIGMSLIQGSMWRALHTLHALYTEQLR